MRAYWNVWDVVLPPVCGLIASIVLTAIFAVVCLAALGLGWVPAFPWSGVLGFGLGCWSGVAAFLWVKD